MKKQKILILLDAHAILHRAYHALPDFKSKKGEPTGALYGFCTLLFKLIKEFSPEYIVACYDLPEKTYRHDAYKDYKAGRAETDEALVVQLESSKEICRVFAGFVSRWFRELLPHYRGIGSGVGAYELNHLQVLHHHWPGGYHFIDYLFFVAKQKAGAAECWYFCAGIRVCVGGRFCL
jgi:hypothetical protein